MTVVIPLPVWKGDPERCGNRFRSRLEQIINIRHELVRLAGEINWQWIDTGLAGLIAGAGRPAVSVRFMVGLLLLKHIHGLSDEGVCARWVNDPNISSTSPAKPSSRTSAPGSALGISGSAISWKLLAEALRVALRHRGGNRALQDRRPSRLQLL